MKGKRLKSSYLLRLIFCVGVWAAVSVLSGCEKKPPAARHIELHEQVHEQIIPEHY